MQGDKDCKTWWADMIWGINIGIGRSDLGQRAANAVVVQLSCTTNLGPFRN